MAIFLKQVVESSSAIVAIEAESKEKADNVFNKFYNGDPRMKDYDDLYDDFRVHMNSSVKDNVIDIGHYNNEDQTP